MTRLRTLLALAFVTTVFPAGLAWAQHDHGDHDAHGTHAEHAEPAEHAEHTAAEQPGDPYLLANDPVSGEPLAGVKQPVVVEHDGRELHFATQESADAFAADPDPVIAAVDAQMIEAQLPYYPLATCVVSGESLDVMGEPVNFLYRNRLVRFCCNECKGKFTANPGEYLEQLDAAVIEAQSASYAPTTCPVSNEPLDAMGEPVERVYGNRLVKFCCSSCADDFVKNPAAYLSKLDAPADKPAPHDDGAQEAEHEHQH